MRGGAEDADAGAGVFDDGEGVQPCSGQGSGFEEVGDEDRVCLAGQERGPGLALLVGNRIDTGVREDFPDRRGGDLGAEGGQFAVECR